MSNPPQTFYRYEYKEYCSVDEWDNAYISSRRLECYTYELVKETPKGYWIGKGFCDKRWVSKDGRKRYAYPTKEQALESYMARTKRRISILQAQINKCESGLRKAETLKKDLKGELCAAHTE